MIVVDASTLVGALTDAGEDGERARRRLLESPDLHAPHHVDLEVMSALRRGVQRRLLDGRRATAAVADLRRLVVSRYPYGALFERIWALRGTVTPYDAAYVALAEALDAPLVTFDRRLAHATGIRCRVELLLE